MPEKITVTAPTTIILADDHELLREGIKSLLNNIPSVRLLAVASDGKELCTLVDNLRPDIVITDIKMPVMDGIEAAAYIKQNHPSIKIIALSTYDEELLILEMIKTGASGYLLKNVSNKELIIALDRIKSGKLYYCNTTSTKLIDYLDKQLDSNNNPPVLFTDRQLQVIKLLCKGMKNKEIATFLHISTRTVETHRLTIQEKIGVRSAAEIAIYATKNNLV